MKNLSSPLLAIGLRILLAVDVILFTALDWNALSMGIILVPLFALAVITTVRAIKKCAATQKVAPRTN
ncbi:hypothetical protein I6I10_03130 [Corynebacterium glucuronolyticum]|uniref:Uncharacterized protein n=1 Tax=Corynebacterium glucuronolyticum TaxID=39791 RepID=A0A7T4EGG1_9CORY|nr:hypothetical protein [Corynebacterium glucuronolyticum]QQB46929.1 hypothetical protein I6I10_03130 [Corynebacterium glucuronolyticum]WKD64794.1 hypothetical protein CGLUCO_12905 [Corynebacterium glucuronolyticum DSM 44120]SMB81801.1 hypothetical protein SAMN05660745_02491 [Corynebacterium glucuronolyticum]